jgi:putative DNA primase/helicase
LILTEGEKKSLKSTQEGFLTIGLTGVWNWQRKRPRGEDGKGKGPRELIPDLAGVRWQGRRVYLCFDSDATDNRNVALAEFHLADALSGVGAQVKIVRLPPGEPGPDGKPAKVGLDDFLVAHGPDAFRELLAAAVEPEKPLLPKEGLTDPHRLAREYRAQHENQDRWRIAFYREQFWTWDGTKWNVIPDPEMRARTSMFCKDNLDRLSVLIAKDRTGEGEPPPVPRVTTALVSNVLQALTGLVLIGQETGQPSWLGHGSAERNYLALQNGILDID